MKATTRLHALGQSLWLDNITRDLLTSGKLERYRTELCITGLTSNPTVFEHSIRNTNAYDDAIDWKIRRGMPCDTLFFELAIEDITRAATSFRLVHEAIQGVDGWVSLEVSPLLADDAAETIEKAMQLHASAQCNNLFIKVPGTKAGIQAIEELIFASVPINITLLFSSEHYLAAAGAYARGVRRRMAADLDPKVHCVASIFVSRGDQAIQGRTPPALHNHLGIAIAKKNLQNPPRTSACTPMARPGQERSPAAASIVGKHGNEGPETARRILRRGACRAAHHQHHARKNIARIRRARRGERRHAGRRQ